MAKKSKAVKVSSSESESGTPRLQELYSNTVRPALAEELSRKNPHSIPRLEKIVVNMGVGTAVTEKKHLEEAMAALGQIAGQKPVATLSRKAVSGFKLREDLPIGCKVTLRGRRMYEFLDRLISMALPRVRDFRGLSETAFDGCGNYSLGLSEQMVFPEINPGKYFSRWRSFPFNLIWFIHKFECAPYESPTEADALLISSTHTVCSK